MTKAHFYNQNDLLHPLFCTMMVNNIVAMPLSQAHFSDFCARWFFNIRIIFLIKLYNAYHKFIQLKVTTPLKPMDVSSSSNRGVAYSRRVADAL